MGVSLANARVGAFRTALRYGTSLRFALPNGMLHAPHASHILTFYLNLICKCIFALSCLILIVKCLQN
ncbi:MAG: hypothetical protein NZ455_08290 [Bacteroidia bacterium]|nr:hypothetical protein [Bacteroidia bacterium]MDW8346022.1 hypothetical protein [Bacteroidia bacterium]